MHPAWTVSKIDWIKLDPQGWVSWRTSSLNPRPSHVGWRQDKAANIEQSFRYNTTVEIIVQYNVRPSAKASISGTATGQKWKTEKLRTAIRPHRHLVRRSVNAGLRLALLSSRLTTITCYGLLLSNSNPRKHSYGPRLTGSVVIYLLLS